MVTPPSASTPTRRREGNGSGWREPHHNAPAGPHSYDYDMLSPRPYGGNRGPPPPSSYHYNGSNTEYWHSSPPRFGTEHPPPHMAHRGGSGTGPVTGPYWGPPPPSPFDGYRGVPPPGSSRGHHHLQRRSPLRHPYGDEQQVGLEPRVPPSHPGDHNIFQQSQQRQDFSPPAPAAAIGQTPTSRGVQVTVSASADSEETRPSASTSFAGNSKKESDADDDDDDDTNRDDNSRQSKKERGDPLSVLAHVSAGMGGKNKQGKRDEDQASQAAGTKDTNAIMKNIPESDSGSDRSTSATCTRSTAVPVPAPTSPLQRRVKPSPITPSQTPQVSGSKRTPAGRQHQPITPSRSHESSSTADCGGSQSLPPGWEPPQLPHGGSGGSGVGGSGEIFTQPEYSGAPQQSGGPYSTPSRRNRAVTNYGASEFGSPFADSPALVERGSFDSHLDASPYRGVAPLYPPPTPTSSRGGPYFYDEHPPPPPGYGSGGTAYWDAGPPPYSPTYPPSNRGGRGWNQPHPPSHSESYYGPPPPDYSYPPPPPHYGGPEDHDPALYGGNPHLSYHHRGGPSQSMSGSHHPGMPIHSPQMGGPPPYPYGHPPRIEEKTILRKKFSWKHYPELERFLIANRDEYLKHSNMNYTAEQKQYNNWLTERLLEVAGQHNYMFDPEDFNFVAIRDRIRCYYKSYVQTARKRGLKLPEKKQVKSKASASTEQKKE